MKTCDQCNAEIADSSAARCPACGSSSQSRESDSDFIITEAAGDDREFVGGTKRFDSEPSADVSIQEPSALAQDNSDSINSPDSQPLSSLDDDDSDVELQVAAKPPLTDSANEPTVNTQLRPGQATGTDAIDRLTTDQVKDVEDKLYGRSEYLSDREKSDLLGKIGKFTQKKPEIVQQAARPPASAILTQPEQPHVPPKMARMGKGIGYYRNNRVEFVGVQGLHAGDEISLHNRVYELRPQKGLTVVAKALIGAGFLLAIGIAGLMMSANSNMGSGEIAGVVLDSSGSPYLQGASISFPDLGTTVKANAQGMFSAKDLPEGSHRIEFSIGDHDSGVDYATVSRGRITLVSLRPEKTEQTPPRGRLAKHVVKQSPLPESERASAGSKSGNPASKTSVRASKKSGTSPRGSKSKSSGKIRLVANIEGARFELDRKVLGAGNLTYSKIKAGKHSYSVGRDGYKTASGSLTVKSGKTSLLEVTLEPLEQASKEKVFSTDDYYYSGVAALKDQDYRRAIVDLTKVIGDQPSRAEAYFHRGQALAAMKDNDLARDNFIRAAEIYGMKKEYSDALTSFNKATEIDDQSVAAHLGRANLFLARNEEIAAITDYKVVLRLDKRNAKAYFGLGDARFRQGQYKKATKHFKDARSLNKKDPLVHQYLMLSYLALHDYKNVKKSFKKFEKAVTSEQVDRMRDDRKYAAVFQIVDGR